MRTTPKLTLLPILFLLFTFSTTPSKGVRSGQHERAPSIDSLYQRAIQLKSMLKYDSSALLLQEVGPKYREQERWVPYLECQYHLSYCFWANHNSAKAMELSEQMIQLGEEELGADHIALAGFYTILGNIHADRRSKEDYEKCKRYYQRALEITRSHFGDQHPALAGAYERLGIARYLINDYVGAIPYYENALTYLEVPNPDNAYFYYKIHLNLGLSYFGMGHFKKALHNFKRSRFFLSNVLKQKDGRYVKASINVAEALIQLGEVDEALFTLEEIRTLEAEVVEPGNKLKVYYWGCLGESFEAKKDYQKAISYYRRCLSYWDPKKRDDVNGLILEHTRIGACYSKINQFDTAEHHFQEAITLLEKYYDEDNYNWVEPLLNLGMNWMAKGATVSGRDQLFRALSIARKKMGDNHPTVGKIQMELANGYFKAGQLKEADRWVRQAQEAFLLESLSLPPVDKINDLGAYVEACALQGAIKTQLYEQTGELNDLEEARGCFLRSLTYSDSLKFTLQSSSDIQVAQQQLYRLSEKALECLFRLWEISGNSNRYAGEALLFLEKSKSDWLRTSAREWLARKYAGIPDSLIEQELTFKAQYTYYRKLKQTQGKIDESISNYQTAVWQERYIHSKQQLDAFLERLETKYPEYYRLKYDQQTVSLDQIRQYTKDRQEQLITYFWGENELYIMSISGGEVRCSKAADITRIERQLDDFAQAIRQGRGNWSSDRSRLEGFEHYTAIGYELYQVLLEPVLERHSIRKLILVPDGPLGQLPFQILLNELPFGQDLQKLDYRNLAYLIRHYPIQYEHAVSLIFQPKQADKRPKKYLGFAPSYRDDETLTTFFRGESQGNSSWKLERDGWSELRYNRQEIEETVQKTGGDKILGVAATEAAFREKATKANILHVAGHAYSHKSESDYSALIFSKDPQRPEDGQLYAYELYNMPLRSDMTVLSACNTGAGVLRPGEGVMSLSRAFRYAGCPSVMMSLWPANDEATKDIVVNFFDHLTKHSVKSEALQKATLTFLSGVQTDQLAHPYYWGNFVVVGQDDPIEFQKEFPLVPVQTILIAGSLIIGLVGTGWYWRRNHSGSFSRMT